MPPIRRSQRQRARAAAALGHPAQTDVVTPAAEPDPVQPAVRPLTARQRWEADVESRLESTELRQREMREIRTLLQSVLPNVAVASTVPVASSSRDDAVPPPGLHRVRLHQQAVRGSTSRVSASGDGIAPPPWQTGEGLMHAVDNPMAGIVDDINVLPGDTQTRVASLVLPKLALHAHVPEKN